MDEKQVTELARRICAAMLSYQIGVGMDYCYRRYVQDRTELGGLWYEIAEQALATMSRAARRVSSLDRRPADPEPDGWSVPWPRRS